MSPIWIPELLGISVLAAGQHFIWQASQNTILELPTSAASQGATSQALLGASSVATCGAAGLFAVDTSSGEVGPVPLVRASSLSEPTAAALLNDGRMLVACGASGEVICLDAEAEPIQIISATGGRVHSMGVTESEQSVLLSVDGALLRANLDVDLRASQPIQLLPSSVGVTSFTIDRQGNVYACTPEGLVVFDADGDALLQVSLPTAVSGCCFGGPGERPDRTV